MKKSYALELKGFDCIVFLVLVIAGAADILVQVALFICWLIKHLILRAG